MSFATGLTQSVLTRVTAADSIPYYGKLFPRRDEAHLRTVEALCFAWLVAIGALTWHGTIRLRQLFLAYLLLTWPSTGSATSPPIAMATPARR